MKMIIYSEEGPSCERTYKRAETPPPVSVCVLGTALLSGCGGMNRYQTMELETETEAASGTEDMAVITMGETAAEEDGTEAGESSPEEAAAAEPETEKYQPVDETVVVKADLLNVRKEDRPTPGSTSS